MKNHELESMNLTELDCLEESEINGGILAFLGIFLIGAAAIGGLLLGEWICEKICENRQE